MLVSVGLTGSDLSSLNHRSVSLSCASGFKIFHETPVEPAERAALIASSLKPRGTVSAVAAGEQATISLSGDDALEINISGSKKAASGGWLVLSPVNSASTFVVSSIKRSGTGAQYKGSILVWRHSSRGPMRIALVCDLDEYLKGVLESEIPVSYHIEAIKAQAVAARTYGLHPRIDHGPDLTNVCDSFLCCQCFSGLPTKPSPPHQRAISETAGQVLTYMGAPALALFSSNGGGHTESYENCFSDPVTKNFPPEPLPYLKGVAETTERTPVFNEELLRKIHEGGAPHTVDAWSPHFRWQVHLNADEIESNLHATVQKMISDPERAPFVVAPPSGKFGHVDSFYVTSRGPSGCCIELEIKTSTGNWRFKKELIIRDVFHVPAKKLARLKSARLFFDHERDGLKLLSGITIAGLGWGHGVGLQQTGAQGWAKQGRNYRWILAHYFSDIKVENM